MFSSLVCVAMLGTASSNLPTWQPDYRQAMEISARDHKPVVVVLGSGPASWEKLVVGEISPETASALRANFVCVYVDVKTAEGKKLAQDFEMTTNPGLVMSDRTGQVQAYRHGGTMDEAELHRTVAKLSDPNFVPRTTEANAAAAFQTPAPAPVYSAPSNCPSCQLRQSFYR